MMRKPSQRFSGAFSFFRTTSGRTGRSTDRRVSTPNSYRSTQRTASIAVNLPLAAAQPTSASAEIASAESVVPIEMPNVHQAGQDVLVLGNQCLRNFDPLASTVCIDRPVVETMTPPLTEAAAAVPDTAEGGQSSFLVSAVDGGTPPMPSHDESSGAPGGNFCVADSDFLFPDCFFISSPDGFVVGVAGLENFADKLLQPVEEVQYSQSRLECHCCEQILEFSAGAQFVQCGNCGTLNSVPGHEPPNLRLTSDLGQPQLLRNTENSVQSTRPPRGGRAMIVVCGRCGTRNISNLGCTLVECWSCRAVCQVDYAERRSFRCLPNTQNDHLRGVSNSGRSWVRVMRRHRGRRITRMLRSTQIRDAEQANARILNEAVNNRVTMPDGSTDLDGVRHMETDGLDSGNRAVGTANAFSLCPNEPALQVDVGFQRDSNSFGVGVDNAVPQSAEQAGAGEVPPAEAGGIEAPLGRSSGYFRRNLTRDDRISIRRKVKLLERLRAAVGRRREGTA